MEKQRQYNVRLSEVLIQTLQEVARETGRDRAELVREALALYFDSELWKEEHKKNTKNASEKLSTKVADLEERVRRLEVAQSDIRDIQHTARLDISNARNTTNQATTSPVRTVGKNDEAIINQILEDHGQVSKALLSSVDLTRYGTTANPKNFWDKLRDTLKTMEARGELVAIQGANRAITYRQTVVENGARSTE